MNEAPLLRVERLSRHFPARSLLGWRIGDVRALDGVSFEVAPGETLGIVGESGCGKSTLGKTLAGIHRPDAGRIVFEGEDITGRSASERGAVAPKLQYCYQDPGNSLDPRWTIRRSLNEPLPTSFQEGSSGASGLPESSRCIRVWSSSMSRPRVSTCRCRPRS